jgi:polyisoprenoid-binding protein YceI
MEIHMRYALLASTMLFASTAFAAAEFAPPSTDLTKIPAGTYTLDKSHASITFTINHLGYSKYTGRFDDFDGKLNFDTKNPEKSSVNIEIKMDSVNTNHDVLEKKLIGDGFFNTAKYPTAKFVSTKVVKTSDTTGDITGDFTFMGVTKPVTLKTTFNGGGFNGYTQSNVVGFSAIGKINRSDYNFTAYAPALGDEVKFYIETEFNQPAKKTE